MKYLKEFENFYYKMKIFNYYFFSILNPKQKYTFYKEIYIGCKNS